MNLILLGGNSSINKFWLDNFATILRSNFISVYKHYYRHWETEGELIDLDYELQTLSNFISSKQSYIIVAKSAGVLMTLKGIDQKIFAPDKCVFMGTPILWAKDNHFAIDQWLKEYALPTLFIQQSHDPAMSFSELKQYLLQKEAKNYSLFDIPGDDHIYGDLDSLRNAIINFIKHV